MNSKCNCTEETCLPVWQDDEGICATCNAKLDTTKDILFRRDKIVSTLVFYAPESTVPEFDPDSTDAAILVDRIYRRCKQQDNYTIKTIQDIAAHLLSAKSGSSSSSSQRPSGGSTKAKGSGPATGKSDTKPPQTTNPTQDHPTHPHRTVPRKINIDTKKVI